MKTITVIDPETGEKIPATIEQIAQAAGLRPPPPATPTPPRTCEQILADARTRFGFLTEPELQQLAKDEQHRLTLVLVRCGQCRFIAATQNVEHIINALTAAGDYVRDVSLYRSTR